MKISKAFAAVLGLCLIGNMGAASRAAASSDEAELGNILQRSAAYCERLKQVALNFVCHENMTEKIYFYKQKNVIKRVKDTSTPVFTTELELRREQIRTYVYDYQMVRKEEKRSENRILLEENGRKKNKKNAEIKLLRFYAQFLVYGPVGFLSSYWQQHFDYSLLGKESVGERTAWIVSAVPSSVREENYSFGKIWVDTESYSILRIEWDPRSLPDFKEEVDSSIGDLKRDIRWRVDYGIEKNGIRFPSHQVIGETLTSHTGARHPKYHVDIVYDNYKFFVVETEIKYGMMSSALSRFLICRP